MDKEQEMETMEDVITLVDEDGKSHDFQIIDVIEVEGKEYALLLPADSTDEEDEVLVLRFAEDKFEMIDDEEEFQKVVKVLEELSEEEEEEG